MIEGKQERKKEIMKKWISYIASLAIISSMSVTALAEETTPEETTSVKITQSETTEYVVVTGTYQPGAMEEVYCVDMEWTAMNFTYDGGSKGDWNPKTHQYENTTVGSWTPESKGSITIKNRSNVGINVTIAYQKAEAYQDAQILISDSAATNYLPQMTENLASADNGVDGEAGTPVTGTYTVMPSGTLPEGTTDAEIGTLTVSLISAGN